MFFTLFPRNQLCFNFLLMFYLPYFPTPIVSSFLLMFFFFTLFLYNQLHQVSFKRSFYLISSPASAVSGFLLMYCFCLRSPQSAVSSFLSTIFKLSIDVFPPYCPALSCTSSTLLNSEDADVLLMFLIPVSSFLLKLSPLIAPPLGCSKFSINLSPPRVAPSLSCINFSSTRRMRMCANCCAC